MADEIRTGKRDLVARLHSAFPSLRIGKQRPLIKDADIASMSTAGGERVRCYVLPELADARAAIEQAVGCDLDWDAE